MMLMMGKCLQPNHSPCGKICRMKLLLKLSVFFLLITFAFTLHAQVPNSIDGVTIDITPSNPKPNQKITAYVESYNYDLNAASIVWIVDGKTTEQGIGLKEISLTAPAIGKTMTISAAIRTREGKEVRKQLNLKTGSVDIIWESNGYRPPFYEGRLPFTYQNNIKLIAVPHLSTNGTSEIDPKTLVYSWKLGGQYIENGQGYGKQSVEIPGGNIPKPLEISVEVSSREGTENAKSSISLTPSEPTLAFYEEDALYGVLYNQALSESTRLKNREMKILSVPYGLNTQNQDITYTWMINDIEQQNLVKNRSIIVRTKGDANGSSMINLDVRNNDRILQGIRGRFTLYFTKAQEESEITF